MELFGKLSNDDILCIEREAKDFCLSNGIGFRVKDRCSDDIINLTPVTIFPSAFQRCYFDQVKACQTVVNKLVHRTACNYQFLCDSLENTVKVDDFTNNLFQIYEKIQRNGVTQPNFLGLLRADYMVDDNYTDNKLKQVEINTISASFGGMAPRVTKLHKHMVSKYSSMHNVESAIPVNESAHKLALGLVKAWEMYGNASAYLLIVTEERTINICDQRLIEFEVNEIRPGIKIIRKSFADLLENVEIRGNQLLYVDRIHEIAVIYYRCGYSPEHHANQDVWKLRLFLEQSNAIKCPSINYHLAGCKKIQQVLSRREVLEKFLFTEKEVDEISKTFVRIYHLEMNEAGNSAVDMALNNPTKFVLKPQREGGGNNIYGEDIVDVLKHMRNSSEREAYILMDMINCSSSANYLATPDKSAADNNFEPSQIVAELGIYGVIFGNDSEIFDNYEAGHVLRCKCLGVNEGGVAAGFGFLNSPFLM